MSLNILWPELLFLQNYFHGMWGHTWSLAVEEHFYLVLGLTLCIVSRLRSGKNPFRGMHVIVLVVCIICTSMRTFHYWKHGYEWFRIYAPTHLRIDSLLVGVCISYMYHFHHEQFLEFVNARKKTILAFSLALVLLVCILLPQNSLLMVGIGVFCLYTGFVGFLCLAVTRDVSQSKERISKPLALVAYVGEHSYSLYLWHVIVLTWCPFIIHKLLNIELNIYLWAAIYTIGSILLGIAMAKLIEFPVLKFRDRFFPSRSQN